MGKQKDAMVTEIEDILGCTVEEAKGVDALRPEEFSRRWYALVEAYRRICELANREMRSQYDQLFALIAGVKAPVTFVVQAFAEEQNNISHRRETRLLVEGNEALDQLLRLHGSEENGEPHLPVSALQDLLRTILHPSWWRPGYGVMGFYELARNLEILLRLTQTVKNALSWGVRYGYEDDENKRELIRKHVEVLWIDHGWYEHAFAPEVRRRILYKSRSITKMASMIFGSSEQWCRRPLRIVDTAIRLESETRENTLDILAGAFTIYILSVSNSAEICQRLKPLMPRAVDKLLSSDKAERLRAWFARAEAGTGQPRIGGVEESIAALSERLNNLESIVRRDEQSEDTRKDMLKVLLRNVIEVLDEETVFSRERWENDEASGVVGNYCEFLWENTVDEGFRTTSGPDEYDAWEWLERRRAVTEIALRFREDLPIREYRWKI